MNRLLPPSPHLSWDFRRSKKTLCRRNFAPKEYFAATGTWIHLLLLTSHFGTKICETGTRVGKIQKLACRATHLFGRSHRRVYVDTGTVHPCDNEKCHSKTTSIINLLFLQPLLFWDGFPPRYNLQQIFASYSHPFSQEHRTYGSVQASQVSHNTGETISLRTWPCAPFPESPLCLIRKWSADCSFPI